MSTNIYGSGLRNVGSYQVAGAPYLSASTISGQAIFDFPNVTKRVVVHNNGSNPLQFYFRSTGVNNATSIYVAAGMKVDIDVKCTKLYLYAAPASSTTAQVAAELTNIPTARMYSLDGLGGI